MYKIPTIIIQWIFILISNTWILGFRYDGFSYMEIYPQREEDIRVLNNFAKQFEYDEVSFEFIHSPYRVNATVGVIVSPWVKMRLLQFLSEATVVYKEKISDYQKLIDREFAENRRAVFLSYFRTGYRIDHTAYLRYNQIEDWLKKKVSRITYATFHKFGNTYEKRKLFMVKIVKNDSLPVVWLDGGIHAREWIATSSVLYVIDKLLENSNTTLQLLEKFQFWLVPLVNPDGYEYSHETHRLWRKNRRRFSFMNCVGVDMNRNFPYEWGGESSSSNPCSVQYRGPEAASELEIKAIIAQLTSIKDSLKLVVSVHAFGQYILQPFTFSKSHYPDNYLDMTKVAVETAVLLQKKHNSFYLVGRPPDILYAASGSSDDYVVGQLKIPYSFTIELPDQGNYGFVMPPRFIRPVGEQLWDIILSFTSQVWEMGSTENVTNIIASDLELDD